MSFTDLFVNIFFIILVLILLIYFIYNHTDGKEVNQKPKSENGSDNTSIK